MINPSTLDPISLMKYNMQLNRMLEEECSDVSTDEPNANNSKLQWEKCHKKFVEKTAWIKQMLTL